MKTKAEYEKLLLFNVKEKRWKGWGDISIGDKRERQKRELVLSLLPISSSHTLSDEILAPVLGRSHPQVEALHLYAPRQCIASAPMRFNGGFHCIRRRQIKRNPFPQEKANKLDKLMQSCCITGMKARPLVVQEHGVYENSPSHKLVMW